MVAPLHHWSKHTHLRVNMLHLRPLADCNLATLLRLLASFTHIVTENSPYNVPSTNLKLLSLLQSKLHEKKSTPHNSIAHTLLAVSKTDHLFSILKYQTHHLSHQKLAPTIN